MPVKLYKLDLSPPVRSVLMLSDIYNVPLELVDVDLIKGDHLTPEYLKLNPIHTVPVMVDGDIVLHDSHAILIYLSETYGKNNSLYSEDVKQKALINQKLFFNNSILFPRMRAVTYPIFIENSKVVEDYKLKAIEDAYGFLEAFLSKTKYLAGDSLTIADLAAFPTVCGLVYIKPLDVTKYPKTDAWLKDLQQKPFSKKYNEGPAKFLGEYVQKVMSQS